MNKRLWKCEGGIDIYGYLDNYTWGVCRLVNTPKSKTLYGKSMNDLKGKIENYLEKELGLKIQYSNPIDKFPTPLLIVSLDEIKKKTELAYYQKMQYAILGRRLRGQYEIVSHYWVDGYLKDIVIDLVKQKIYPHPSGLYFDILTLEIARTFPYYIVGCIRGLDKLNNKIIGVNPEGEEEWCELKITEDRKSFKIKQDLKIIKPDYFKYFLSNGSCETIIDYSYCGKFPEWLQQHLDIS